VTVTKQQALLDKCHIPVNSNLIICYFYQNSQNSLAVTVQCWLYHWNFSYIDYTWTSCSL